MRGEVGYICCYEPVRQSFKDMNIKSLEGPDSVVQFKEPIFFRRGGMGEIYSAIDLSTNLKKAIKVVPIENDDEFHLVQSEFKIAIELKHKNIINTEYFNEFESEGVKYIYSVMSFNENGNLRDYLKKQTELISLNQSLRFMLDLAEGLEYAHKKVVHRDLKPENILFGDEMFLQICDFGLAKLIDAKTRTRTFKGSGTSPYMAPECWMFDSNTTAMDIYSLGIIFYEILTLKLPFVGKTEQEYRNKHLYESLPNISNSRVDLPVRLVEVISKMTNKRQQERYSTMPEIAKALKEISQKADEIKDSKMDSLLSKANEKISSNQQAELKRQKEQELIDTDMKFLDFSKKSLLEMFSLRIEELNKSLERTKIYVNKNSSTFSARFMNKGFSISFFQNSDIPKMIQSRREAILQNQKRQYGFVMMSPPPTHIEKDNVVLIGKLCIDSNSYNSESWGYNLLLRKANPEDLYGEWWVVWFDNSAIISKHPLSYHYAIGIPDFYQEYEHGRGHAIHVRTMGMNTLKAEGIDKMIEKILE